MTYVSDSELTRPPHAVLCPGTDPGMETVNSDPVQFQNSLPGFAQICGHPGCQVRGAGRPARKHCYAGRDARPPLARFAVSNPSATTCLMAPDNCNSMPL